MNILFEFNHMIREDHSFYLINILITHYIIHFKVILKNIVITFLILLNYIEGKVRTFYTSCIVHLAIRLKQISLSIINVLLILTCYSEWTYYQTYRYKDALIYCMAFDELVISGAKTFVSYVRRDTEFQTSVLVIRFCPLHWSLIGKQIINIKKTYIDTKKLLQYYILYYCVLYTQHNTQFCSLFVTLIIHAMEFKQLYIHVPKIKTLDRKCLVQTTSLWTTIILYWLTTDNLCFG
ncbi:hypothetical protein AGLY_007119 [Aphis glycines]|uniref:Uncharacterized protein n=1 Tax=Aphis glycines TaxID=307491 RepID=A0A6G0TQY8_APHGL|nr:hypothetical protein AGLY_007119 [Aphis glycines]